MLNSESEKRSNERLKTLRSRKKKYEHINNKPINQKGPEVWDSMKQERYKTVIENIPCAVYSAYPGKAGPTTFISNKWKDWTGYSPEELYRDPEAWPKCIHPDDREYAVNTYIEACRDMMAYNLDYRIVHKDTGQLRYVRDQGHLSKDENGVVVRVNGIVTDITELRKSNSELDKYKSSLEELVTNRTAELTSAYETLKLENKERKRVEQALREIEREQTTVLENLSDLIVYRDRDMVTRWASKSMANWHGMTQEQIIGRVCYKARYRRDEPCDECHVIEAVKSGKRQELEKQLPGEIYWHVTVNPVLDDSGQVIGTIEISQDITERKKADDEFRKSKDILEKTFTSLDSAIFILDSKNPPVIIDFNPAAARIFGYGKEEMLGRTTEFLHVNKEKLLEFQEALRQSIEEQGGLSFFEFMMRRKDGRIFPSEHSVRSLKDDKGRIIGWVSVVRDITERKQSEDALRETTNLLETIFEHTHMLVAYLDPKFNFVRVNRAYAEADERQPSFFPGRNHFDLYPNEENEVIFRRAVETGVPYFAYAKPFEYTEHPERGISYWDWSLVPIKNQREVVSGLVLTLADVTARKRAEESLKASEGKLNAILQSISDHMSMMDENLNILWTNNVAKRRFGDDIVGRKCYEVYHGRQSPCEPHPCPVLHAFTDGRIHDRDIEVTDKNGNAIWFHCVANVALRNEHGRAMTVLEISKDITERKRAEEALREREALLMSIFRAAPIGIGLVSDRVLLKVNDKICYMVGYSREELVGQNSRILYPSDEEYEYVGREKYRQIQDIGTGMIETRWKHKDGRIIDIILSSTVIDSTDFSKGVTFTALDITERKRAEEALRESEVKFRTLAEQSPNMIFINRKGRIVYANKKCEEVMGYTREELCSPDFDFRILIAPESIELINENLARHLRGENIRPCDYTIIDKDGKRIEAIYTSKLIQYDGETAILGIVTDITERKRAEQLRMAHIHFLESLDRINRAIQGASDLDQMMSDVLDTTLSVFKCDRAFLFYPCDPEADSWRVPMERTVPEYPGAFASGVKVPMDQGASRVLRTVLESDGPVKFGPMSEHALPVESEKDFGFKSQIAMAIHPKVGNSWMFGLHQCSHPRIWTEEEEKLFQEIGRRITDAMSSMLTLHDLRESRERYRALVENAELGIALISKDYEIIMSNAAQGRMIRKDHRSYIGGKCYFEFEKRNEVCPHCPGKRAMESGRVHEAVTEGVRADGTKVSVRVQACPVYAEDGNVDSFVEIVEDISERKKAEQALRESEERLKILFESAPDTIYLIDSEGRFVDANRAAFELIGFARDEVIGKSLAELDLLSAEQLSKAKTNLKKVVTGKLSGPNQYILKKKDGSHISIEVRTFPVKIGGKMLTLGIARDITEHKQTEEKILEHQAKLKSLASQLSLTEERERHRLATDLHDQISQSLVISKIKLDQLRKSSDSDEYNEPLEDISNCLGRIIDDTRALTFDLSYPILYELGFEAAVAEWLTDQIQEKHRIKTEFEDDGLPKPLDDDICVLLFRNVRELLINVVKHSQANKVRVSIRKVNDNIEVGVEDDGVGFDPHEVTTMATKRAEFGLFSIRERLEQLGGIIEIDSEPGCGSRITMRAPLKYNNQTDRVSK